MITNAQFTVIRALQQRKADFGSVYETHPNPLKSTVFNVHIWNQGHHLYRQTEMQEDIMCIDAADIKICTGKSRWGWGPEEDRKRKCWFPCTSLANSMHLLREF